MMGVCLDGNVGHHMFPSGSRDKHTAHQVRSKAARLSLKGLAPIAREMQVKQGLRAAVFPSKLSASLIVPVLTSCASGPHAPLIGRVPDALRKRRKMFETLPSKKS